MINKKTIAVSAGSAMAQTIVSGMAVFVLFRLILNTIGSAKLGIWSLVLGTSSMVRLANLGISESIAKLVADCDATGDREKISVIVQTAVISLAVFTLTLIIAAYPAAKEYFRYVLHPLAYRDAVGILPAAMVAFFVAMVCGVYQGALYGCQKIVHRNLILMVDSISYLALAAVLMKPYGLMGLAYARLAQNCLTLTLTVALLKKHVTELPLLPTVWRKRNFKEMIAFAANFQIISLLVMLSDPVTKGFLSRFGDISMVGYYEMANRVVQIFKNLLVNANQVLVPTFAHLEKLAPARVASTYLASYQVVYYLTVPGFFLLAIAAPFVAQLLIGHYEPFFVWATMALCGGWLINTLSVPAYFATIGAGRMRANVISHVVMTVSNVVLIYLLGRAWGGVGVMLAWSASLALGGLIINVMYYRTYKIAWGNTIPRASRVLTALCLLGLVVAYSIRGWTPAFTGKFPLPLEPGSAPVFASTLTITAFVMIIGFPMWVHPVRRRLWEILAERHVTGRVIRSNASTNRDT